MIWLKATSFQRYWFSALGNDNDLMLVVSGSFTLYLIQLAQHYVKHFICVKIIVTGYTNYAPGELDNYIAGYGNTTSAVNAVQFKFDTGNIDDGIIKMYGVKKS
jgi:hypothetical protein